jgi:hypothetical protein
MTIDYNSPISITAQTLAARIPNMSDADIEYLSRRLWLETSYRIDPSLVPSYRSELGSSSDPLPDQSELGTELGTNTSLVPNQSEELGTELGTNTSLVPNQSEELGTELGTNTPLVPNSVPNQPDMPVPIGCVEYKPVPKNGKEYFYYYWRYYAADGSKRSIYLAATKQKAIAKIQRIGIPSDARVSDR